MDTLWNIVAIIAIAFLAGLWIKNRLSTSKTCRQAEAMLSEGNWREAARIYKDNIAARLDSPRAVQELKRRLSLIYDANGITANLDHLDQKPVEIKRILKSRTNDREKGRLAQELIDDTKRWLGELP
jgi:hypothetical protein